MSKCSNNCKRKTKNLLSNLQKHSSKHRRCKTKASNCNKPSCNSNRPQLHNINNCRPCRLQRERRVHKFRSYRLSKAQPNKRLLSSKLKSKHWRRVLRLLQIQMQLLILEHTVVGMVSQRPWACNLNMASPWCNNQWWCNLDINSQWDISSQWCSQACSQWDKWDMRSLWCSLWVTNSLWVTSSLWCSQACSQWATSSQWACSLACNLWCSLACSQACIQECNQACSPCKANNTWCNLVCNQACSSLWEANLVNTQANTVNSECIKTNLKHHLTNHIELRVILKLINNSFY